MLPDNIHGNQLGIAYILIVHLPAVLFPFFFFNNFLIEVWERASCLFCCRLKKHDVVSTGRPFQQRTMTINGLHEKKKKREGEKQKKYEAAITTKDRQQVMSKVSACT